MGQKSIKKIKKFCKLFNLDYENAKDVFNKLSDEDKNKELKNMKFALTIRSKEVKTNEMIEKFKKNVKFTVSKKILREFERRRNAKTSR